MEFDVFYFLTCPKLLFESIISHLFMHNISYEIVLGISRAYLVFSFCFLINDLNSCLLFQLGTYSIFQPSRFVMHHIPYLLANFFPYNLVMNQLAYVERNKFMFALLNMSFIIALQNSDMCTFSTNYHATLWTILVSRTSLQNNFCDWYRSLLL